MAGTMTHPNLFQRLRAAFSGTLIHPAQKQSDRMPDLERWNMPHRSVDMRDWELALRMATNVHRPDRSRLMDLYDSLVKDAHLGSVLETRVLRVQRSKFKLVDASGKARPELVALLETQWFEDILRFIVEAAFVGHTLIELGEMPKPGHLKRVNRIDPRNVLPHHGVVSKRQGEETGYKFREEPLRTYLIEVGREDDLGLLERVAPVAIIKKYAVGSWSAFVGTYGIPSRWVKTSARDARRVKQLETVMQQMLSSAYAVIQGDEEFGISPTPGGDPHKVFDDLISRMNSETSKRVLGTDGTTDNKDASGTFGSLQVLQGVAEDRHQSDKTAVMYVVNEELLPRLVALGYPFKGIRFQWDELRDMAPMELVDAVSKLGLVFDIDPKHIEERTGIKILGARRMPGEIGDPYNLPGTGRQSGKKKGEGGEEPDEPEDEPDGVTALRGGPVLPSCAICGGGGGIRAEEVPHISVEAIESLLNSAWNGREFDPAYYENVASLYLETLDRTWNPASLGVGVDAPEHVAHALMEANLFQFSGLKTLAATLDLNAYAKDGGTFADFKRRVDESGVLADYNEHQLRAEHTNVAMSGIQAGRYYQMQQTSDILPFGEYVTVGDGNVRPAHAELNGKKWPLDHAVWGTIWPPNGWNCRCTVLPADAGPTGAQADKQWAIDEETLKRSGELGRMTKHGFNGNRGQTGSIFSLNKSFRQTLGDRAGRKQTLNPEMAYGRTDMDRASILKRQLPEANSRLTGEDQYEQWYKDQAALLSDSKGRATFRDHKGRPWALDYSTLTEHALPKYAEERRWEYLHLMPDILAAPDEVWTDKGPNHVRQYYVKFYKDKPLVVRAEIPSIAERKGNTLTITSWFEMAIKDEPFVRSGLLTKKMPVAD